MGTTDESAKVTLFITFRGGLNCVKNRDKNSPAPQRPLSSPTLLWIPHCTWNHSDINKDTGETHQATTPLSSIALPITWVNDWPFPLWATRKLVAGGCGRDEQVPYATRLLLQRFNLERGHCDVKFHNHQTRNLPKESTVWSRKKKKIMVVMLHKYTYMATGDEHWETAELISLLTSMLNFIFQISSHSNSCCVETFLKRSNSGSLMQDFLLL